MAAIDQGEPLALVSVIQGPSVDAVGRRLVVTRDAVAGTSGSADVDAFAVKLARDSLGGDRSGLHHTRIGREEWTLFVESQHPRPDLIIVGAGHIARPLCHLGDLLGFRVTVVDDRPEFAAREWFREADRVEVVDFSDPFRGMAIGGQSYIVLVTRGHKYDYDCILRVLEAPSQPAYLGMIGSRRRVRAAFEALVREGVAAERLERVHAPIGLDIAAETPEEIALAIAAEIVAVRRGGRGGMLSREEGVLKRVVARKVEDRKDRGGSGDV